jgi:hypothetical protein
MSSKNPKAVFIDDKIKKINSYDENWYTRDGKTYYPSVTTYLSAYPKGAGFYKWLKGEGFNAEKVLEEATRQGSMVHNMIERFLKGESIDYAEEQKLNPGITFYDWTLFMKFIDFMKLCRPKPLGVEIPLVDGHIRTGGTLDFPCMINGQRWLIDHKTSNYVWHTQYIQLHVYVHMWNKKFPDQQIERAGIFHMKATTRTVSDGSPKYNKDGVTLAKRQPGIQGVGWKIDEIDLDPKVHKNFMDQFHACRVTWNSLPENKNAAPKNLEFPSMVSFAELQKELEEADQKIHDDLTNDLKQSIEKESDNG